MTGNPPPAPPRPRPSVRLSLATRLSLTTKMSLGFFSITLLAIAALYLYVAPGLQNRLMASKLSDLRDTARVHAASLRSTVGSSTSLPKVRQLVMATSESTGNRVTLLSVNRVDGRPELTMQMDSSMSRHTPVRLSLAHRAITTRRIITGTDRTAAGVLVAQAADPVVLGGRVAAVIVFTSSVTDVLRTVSTVRHEILVAGGLALLVALIAGMLIARALTQRVRRLDQAAQRVAAGTFGDPIPVESGDELGQLAVSFNEMQSQLLALEQARKRFIATASHELRTPIFSLGGFVELLEDDDLDNETRRRFLDQIRDQVQRLGKLSVDLLDLSRLESGTLQLRPEEVDLGELTRSVAGEFEPTLHQHDAHLQVRLAGGGEQLEAACDPVRVAQIVRILIDNALTHTPSGTTITVSVARGPVGLELTVHDDGEGIDPTAIGRVFEPFFTADHAAGSGLGLAIASELAERMRGRLSVASTAGDTTFTLRLPATAPVGAAVAVR